MFTLGGLWYCGPVRRQYYIADAWAWLTPGSSDALDHTKRAVAAYGDYDSGEWAIGNQAASYAALAISHIATNELDGASETEAMQTVLALPPEHRTTGVISSVHRVGSMLDRSASTAIPELAEQIERFTRSSAGKAACVGMRLDPSGLSDRAEGPTA